MIDPAAPDQVFKLMGTIGATSVCVTSTPTPNGTPCLRGGCLDPMFDFDGLVTTEVGDATGEDVAIQPDGKIVVAGLANRGSNADMGVVRLTGVRVLFGVDSIWLDYAAAVVVQPDGKIVVAGTAYRSANFTPTDFALARYNTDGSLDTGFDGDGKVTVSFANGHEEAADLGRVYDHTVQESTRQI